MSYRADVTDKEQDELEQATFDGGIPVEVDGKQRVVAKAADGAPYRVAGASSSGRKNAGVVMSHDDVPNRFVSETQGKA